MCKGKIERFMGTVEAFLSEVRLAQPKSLTELNQLFSTWLEEGYNHKPHTGLEGQTPEEAFARDLRPVRFVTQEKLREAFLWEEDRKVDRTGCFKLGGEVYEAGPTLAGKKVEIHFDPFNSTEVEVWHKGQKVTVAKKLDLAAKAKSKAEDKDAVTGEGKEATAPSTSSRYLATLKKKEKERLRRKLGALAYRNLEGKDHV
ncbi:MAG: Mu transposase C-terminal domain-containing protein [Moorellaceae bacterium]